MPGPTLGTQVARTPVAARDDPLHPLEQHCALGEGRRHPVVVAALTAGNSLVGEGGQAQCREPQPAVHPLTGDRVEVELRPLGESHRTLWVALPGQPVGFAAAGRRTPTCGSASQLSSSAANLRAASGTPRATAA